MTLPGIVNDAVLDAIKLVAGLYRGSVHQLEFGRPENGMRVLVGRVVVFEIP